MDAAKAAGIEKYRKRYEALMAAGLAKDSWQPAAQPGNPAALDPELVVEKLDIPGGGYATFRLQRGRTLRLVNTEGTPGVAALFWNADDFSERYYAGDTVKIQWTSKLSKGRLLFSEMGRVLVSITDDTGGLNDTIIGGSTAWSNAKRYGDAPTRNSRDNFIVAAVKLGLGRGDIPPAVSFFSGLKTDEHGAFHWVEGSDKPGSRIDLRAEMNLVAVVSNCPHPFAPGPYAPKPISAAVWRSAPPAPNDFCRTGTEEAIRAFINTDAYFNR